MAIRVTLSNRKELNLKDDRYTVKDSGVLVVKTDDNRVMHLSPSGWLAVEELQVRKPSTMTSV